MGGSTVTPTDFKLLEYTLIGVTACSRRQLHFVSAIGGGRRDRTRGRSSIRKYGHEMGNSDLLLSARMTMLPMVRLGW